MIPNSKILIEIKDRMYSGHQISTMEECVRHYSFDSDSHDSLRILQRENERHCEVLGRLLEQLIITGVLKEENLEKIFDVNSVKVMIDE